MLKLLLLFLAFSISLAAALPVLPLGQEVLENRSVEVPGFSAQETSKITLFDIDNTTPAGLQVKPLGHVGPGSRPGLAGDTQTLLAVSIGGFFR